MNDDTAHWLDTAPLAGLQCRDLRHAWPRAQQRSSVRARPPSTPLIVWKVLTVSAGRPVELERTMLCEGGCGVARVEVFVARKGGDLVRSGVPRYRHPKHYLRQRAEPDSPLERLDPDVLRGRLVARLYPALKW